MDKFILEYYDNEGKRTITLQKEFDGDADLVNMLQMFADFLVSTGYTYIENVGCVDNRGKQTWGPY
jgi:hypothetical protein